MTQRMFSAPGATADREAHERTDASRETLENRNRKDLEKPHRDTPGRVQRYPVKTMVGALAIGSVIGWVLHRR